MATLPFVVQPRRKPILERVGSEESGVIEVERRGYLTAGEKAFVQQVQQFDNGTTEIVTVSRRVARKYSLGMDKAYNLVLAIISNGTAEDTELASQVEEEFAEELTNVLKSLSAGQVREELIMSACLLKYRVDADFDIGVISSIHPDLISGLAKLYREEEARSIEAFKETNDEGQEKPLSVEEAEKKSVKTAASRSKTTTGV